MEVQQGGEVEFQKDKKMQLLLFVFCIYEDTSWKIFYLLYIELKLTSLKFLCTVPSGVIKNIIFQMKALQKLKDNSDAFAKSLLSQDKHGQNNPADN